MPVRAPGQQAMSKLILPSRRGFLLGSLASLAASPAIVRAASLMPVRALPVISGIDFGSGDYSIGSIIRFTNLTGYTIDAKIVAQITNEALDSFVKQLQDKTILTSLQLKA